MISPNSYKMGMIAGIHCPKKKTGAQQGGWNPVWRWAQREARAASGNSGGGHEVGAANSENSRIL